MRPSRGDWDPSDTAFGDPAASFGSGPPALQGPAPHDLLNVAFPRSKVSSKEAPASPALLLVLENPGQLPLLHPISRLGQRGLELPANHFRRSPRGRPGVVVLRRPRPCPLSPEPCPLL